MLEAVIIFALITATLELFLLLKFVSVETMQKKWFATLVHLGVAMLNLIVHWGTITGTMTAITAALVSFATLPLAIYIGIFIRRWKTRHLHTTRG